MPSFGMVNEHFTGWDIATTCETLAGIGYDGIEVTPWTVTDSILDTGADPGRVRDAAAAANLDVIGVPRIFAADQDGYHIGHPNPAIRERTVKVLRATVRFCGAIGGDVVLFGSPNQRTVGPTMDEAAVWERAVGTFGHDELLDDLAEAGVSLCMEPLSPPHTDFVTTADEAVQFVEAIDHPNVGLVLDAYHLADEEDPPATVIERCGSVLTHFHADNTQGIGPVSGAVDFAEVAAALERIGYSGYVSVELHTHILGDRFSGDPVETATESLAFLRSVFDR